MRSAPRSLIYEFGSGKAARALHDLRRFEWSRVHVDELLEMAGVVKRRPWADLGSGWGAWSFVFAEASGSSVQALDADPMMVEQCREIARATGLKVRGVLGDVLDQSSLREAFYQGITCQLLLRHSGRPSELLDNARRWLRPGGQVLLVERDSVAQWRSILVDPRDGLPEKPVGWGEFYRRASRGLRGLGLGDRCVIEELDGLIESAGFEDLGRYENPAVLRLEPPYDPYSRQLADELIAWWDYDVDEALVQGARGAGMDAEQIDVLTGAETAWRRQLCVGLRRGSLALSMSTGLVAVWGRKGTMAS